MKNPENFLVFCGNPGIGKTYLCAALTGWALFKFGTNFRKWTEYDLLRKVREGIDKNWEQIKCLKDLIDDSLIILDDVGSQSITDWRRDIFFDAIDFRYNSMLPTIITTNMYREDFKTRYHERVYSRVFATENTIIELHDGEDFRQQGK